MEHLSQEHNKDKVKTNKKITHIGIEAYGIDDATFEYIENAVQCTDEEILELKELLLNNPRREINMYGKKMLRPRHEAVFGKDYLYSNTLIRKEKERNILVDRCLDHANEGKPDRPFTWALVNLYIDGTDYVSYHRDNEKDVGGNEVRTYSFGVERDFIMRTTKQIKRKRARKHRFVFHLEHGSCGIMSGPASQVKWEHGIPVRKKIKDWRISITPRC
jgi:alkylated DNA repair dioxygenase AlkB